MSGGSWDYVTYKFQDVADRLKEEKDTLRRALGGHIELIVKAMRDIEWVDSGDYGPGDEVESIKKVLKSHKELRMAILIQDGNKVIKELKDLIKE